MIITADLTGPAPFADIERADFIVPSRRPARLDYTADGIRANLKAKKLGVENGVNLKLGLPAPAKTIKVSSEMRFEGDPAWGGKLFSAGIDNKTDGGSWTGGKVPTTPGGMSARFMWKTNLGEHFIFPYFYRAGMSKGSTGMYGPALMRLIPGEWHTLYIRANTRLGTLTFYVGSTTGKSVLWDTNFGPGEPVTQILMTGIAGGSRPEHRLNGPVTMTARKLTIEYQ